MSPLTKAFVVLVTLLSILLVTLVVPFVASVDNLREEATAAKDRASAASASINSLKADLLTARETIEAKEAAQNTALNQLQSQVSQLQGQNSSLTAQVAQAKADAQSTQALLETYAENDRTKTTLIDGYVARIETLQQKLVDRTTENTQLVDRNNALTNEVGQLFRSVRKLREQTITFQEEIARLTATLVAADIDIPSDDVQVPVVASGEPIYGQITALQTTTGGKELVEINLGSSDGIVAKQQFVAYRLTGGGQEELVGRLEIMSVDESVAVAAVVNRQQAIQTGDFVVSALGL